MFSEKLSATKKLNMVVCGLSILILVLGLPVSSDLANAAQKETVDGVLHIKNGSKPGKIETIELDELWTAGGEDDEDVLFGIISKVQIDAENNIYLLDNQMSQVYVYSPTGELLKTLGRAGEGPGEVSGPAGMILLKDGSIGLLKLMPATLVMLDKEGIPAGNYTPGGGTTTEGGMVVAVNCYQAGDNFVFGTVDISMDNTTMTQTRTYSLDSYGPDTEPLVRYGEKEVVWEFQNNFVMREIDTDFVWQRMDVSSEGLVAMALDRNKYEINIFQPDGTLDRVIHRQHEPLERGQEMKDLLDRAFETLMRQMPPGSRYEYEPNEAEIQNLRIAKDGSIWVQHSHQVWEPEPDVFCFDVFNKEGDFVAEKRFKCPGSAKNDRLFFTDDGKVFKVAGLLAAAIAAQGIGGDSEEEAEPMSVTCYEIK